MVVHQYDPVIQLGQQPAPAFTRRDQIALGVIVGRRGILPWVDAEHAEAVPDGDAGRDDQKIVREAGVVAVFLPVEEMIDNQRGHDHSLAGAGGHLESLTRQASTVGGIGIRQFPQGEGAGVGFFRDFVQPDGRFDGFLLGKEEAAGGIAFRIGEPEVKQFAGDPGGLRVAFNAPGGHLAPQPVDQMMRAIRVLLLH